MTATHLKQVSAAQVPFVTKAAASLQIVRSGRVLGGGLEPGACRSTHLQLWSNFHLRRISQKLVVLLTVWCLDSLKCFFQAVCAFQVVQPACTHISCFTSSCTTCPCWASWTVLRYITYPIFLCIAFSRWKPVCAASCLLWSALLDRPLRSITLSDKVVRGCSSKQHTLGDCELCRVLQLHLGVWFVKADRGNRRLHISAQCPHCWGGRAAFCLRNQECFLS